MTTTTFTQSSWYGCTSPCDDVAVKARAPAAEAPTHAAMAECSDSTLMKRALSSPLAHISDSSSTICVCGVIG